ncbi:MAG: ISKra4 family transposase [Planctomycetes bacterium]|nr:ISKra4 family transposase [Planctomycetota bacterium]
MQTKRPGRGAVEDLIVIAVPAACKRMVSSIEALCAAVAARAASGAASREAVDYAVAEIMVAELTAAVERDAHAVMLSALEVDAPRVEIDGEVHTRVGYGNGRYRSLAGAIEVPRALYRPLGAGNAPTVDAISLRAGAIGDGWLPQTARAMAHDLQKAPSRDGEQTGKESGRLPYSRASFERVPHEVGALYLRHQVNIEDAIVRSLEIPAEARAISVSLDRASVPMEEPIPQPPGRPRKNAPRIKRVLHMAYCGTVTLHDGDGRALYSMRFGQIPCIDPQDVCNAMANVVYRLRERQPALRVQLLADGAHEMWNLLKSSFPENLFGPRHLMIDFWHVLEKLSAAAEAIHDSGGKAVVAGWRRLLELRKDAAMQILAELEASWCEPVDDDVVTDGLVHDAITYLTNHAHRMNYAGARAKGLPIGSGIVEATCKSLIGARLKRAGSRWKQDTGDHVIKLRALALSDQWDAAMTRLLATQRTPVRALVA